MKIKKALVTGGSTGIGLAICEHLLAQGVEVFSISRNPSKLLENKKVTQISLDLSLVDLVSDFAESFLSKHGAPDLLINNAGYGAFYELARFPKEEILSQTAVLFISPILLCKAFFPAMEKNEKGTIVNISSLATHYPLPFMSLYNANKAALSSFTLSMLLESKFTKWIDFRLGDVLTLFNKSAPKQEKVLQNINMESAWKQIEKQLNESPLPHSVVRKLFQSISEGKKGTLYGGSFYHAHILSRIHSFIPQFVLIKLLREYYFSVNE